MQRSGSDKAIWEAYLGGHWKRLRRRRLTSPDTPFRKPMTCPRRQIKRGAAMRGYAPSLRFSPALPLGITLLLCAAGAQAGGTPIPHGTLELIAEKQWIAPGHEFRLGLHFQL